VHEGIQKHIKGLMQKTRGKWLPRENQANLETQELKVITSKGKFTYRGDNTGIP
jgi:hypothetical protein